MLFAHQRIDVNAAANFAERTDVLKRANFFLPAIYSRLVTAGILSLVGGR